MNQAGQAVITETAFVHAPFEKVCGPRGEFPEVQLSRHECFRAVLVKARVPVILTSRTDTGRMQLVSYAVAVLLAHCRSVPAQAASQVS